MQRPPHVEARFAGPNGICYNARKLVESACQAMLCNEHSTGSLPEGEECGT